MHADKICEQENDYRERCIIKTFTSQHAARKDVFLLDYGPAPIIGSDSHEPKCCKVCKHPLSVNVSNSQGGLFSILP